MLGLGAAAPCGSAQQTTRLVEYTNVWKYNDSAANLGTAWREPDYDDSAWPSGPGLLGVETTVPFPYPVAINTPMTLGVPPTVTYYLRTRFQWSESSLASGLVLRADNYVDDGCVIYLNGVEAGRVRVATSQNYLTPAAPASTYEGNNESILIDTNLLRLGENILAVEVHQNAVPSSDIVWGMRLTAVVPQQLGITEHPQDQVSTLLPIGPVNSPVIFDVSISGGPATYQWRKDGVNIPNATTPTFKIAQPQASDAGAYSVVVSNLLGSIGE